MARTLFDRWSVFTGFTRNDCTDFPTVPTLLAAIRSDDANQQNQAIKCLYSRFEPLAYNVARKFNKDRSEAFDPMNNVLIKLYERIRDRHLNFLTEEEMNRYVWKALYYQFRQSWVWGRRVDYYGDPNELSNLEQSPVDMNTDFDRVANAERVQLALHRSTKQCRDKLLLHHEGYSYEEIGELLQITAEAAKNAVYRCRERLKKLFNELGEAR